MINVQKFAQNQSERDIYIRQEIFYIWEMLATKNCLGFWTREFENSFLAFGKLSFSRSEFQIQIPLLAQLSTHQYWYSAPPSPPHPQNISTYIYVLQVTLVFILSISSLGIYFINTSRYFLFYSFPIKSIISFSSIRHPATQDCIFPDPAMTEWSNVSRGTRIDCSKSTWPSTSSSWFTNLLKSNF